MGIKGLTISCIVGLFAWQSVQASSITTRVRVLETKIGQFERQANQERAAQKIQFEQVKKNTDEIEGLKLKVDTIQQHFDKQAEQPTGKKSRHVSTDHRFSDSRYAFP